MNLMAILFLGIHMLSFASETCSRVALINYQEVLVDTGSSKKGEGLRYYLEKDEQALSLLNEYQKKNQPSRLRTAFSTTGTVLLIGGLMQTNKNEGITNSNTLIYGGAIMMAVSYLTAKTFQYNNEAYLTKSIEEYNKRNSPKIFFSPYTQSNQTGFGLGLTKEF